ncbi:PREDICTED: uncharacterized protein LOC104807525 isoform X8 [Tarenaya hassleriana]|uniref:uncharacterized protein LOC104807525 isoform X8 n=1 Tax=Tarenaya hassleriana TaxID=28532 RepID=UPI00053C9965|nr:PREDICTED: uncharacterized protein LOC104807525 isoform X8 [Tarenaya hassleriana]
MEKVAETPAKSEAVKFLQIQRKADKSQKPPFRPAIDDTKPVLQDPILRSDPMETEEAVLRLPPFPSSHS